MEKQMTSYETLKRHLEQKLIKYLNKYLKKDFKMNPIFKNLKRTLSDEEEITEQEDPLDRAANLAKQPLPGYMSDMTGLGLKRSQYDQEKGSADCGSNSGI